ncbi:MAG TPA: glycosyltransferase family 39 protein [Pyrinomonadaceae bacterium]|nr:glycosyltransferase family 39 protein [Pyrinomonadaceae bacterium]
MLAKRGWLLLFLSIAAFYLWGLGSLPLVGPDEPRYAQVAREMFARHDLITPTLGGLPWFEKPPLLYWLMIAGYRVLGVSEYAARLGPAVCGLLTAVFVYWTGKTVEDAGAISSSKTAEDEEQRRDGLGRFSALVWLSSLGVIVFSRGASFDIVVTMTITGALACFFVWEVRYRTRSGSDGVGAGPNILLVGFYLFIGLSLLAKGLIGIVIPFGVISAYYLLKREWPNGKFVKSLSWGLPLAIAVAAVWFGPMLSRHGWKFVDQFIVQHHFARFVTNKYHHPAPFYFYLEVLVALAAPWTVFLAAGFWSSQRWHWRGRMPLDCFRVLAFCWVVVPVVFFSFSESKLTAYILPALPAVGLLTGERVTCFLQAQRGDLVFRVTGVLLLALGVCGGWYLAHRSGLSFPCIVLGCSPLVVVGAAALARPQLRKVLVILIPLALFVASAIGLSCAAPVLARPESVRDLLAAGATRGDGATPVVQLHTVERTAEFYAAGRMTYGADGEPVKLEGVAQVAEAARRNGGVVLCFVPKEYEAQLTTYPSIEAEVVGNNGRVSLLVVRVK